MTLSDQLAEIRRQFLRENSEERAALYQQKIDELRASFLLDAAIGAGDIAPDFTLPGAQGAPLTLSDLLRKGPVVLTFYRGGWCPYCNFQLRSYQAALPAWEALGARLVAVSPQLPDESLSSAERNGLSFDVLSDVGNEVARAYGLVFTLAREWQEIMTEKGKSLIDINGDESWELPVPATYVIGRDGRVALAYLDVDYRNRLEPAQILAALEAL